MSEINRRIAELRGWTEIEEEDWFIEDFDVYDRVEGLVGKNPSDGYRYPLPDYEHDLNAAIELLKESTVIAGLDWIPSEQLWEATIFTNPPDDYYRYAEATPALAICKAWLAWYEAQEKAVNENGR